MRKKVEVKKVIEKIFCDICGGESGMSYKCKICDAEVCKNHWMDVDIMYNKKMDRASPTNPIYDYKKMSIRGKFCTDCLSKPGGFILIADKLQNKSDDYEEDDADDNEEDSDMAP